MITASLLWVLTSLSLGAGDIDSLDKKLSIELEAAPAERLLPELGKAWGVRLRAEGATRNDVLVVSVKDVTLKDLMARIARLDSAGWQKAPDGGYELIRTTEQKRDQEREDRAKEAGAIREAIENYVKSIAKSGSLTATEADALVKQNAQANADIVKVDQANQPEMHRLFDLMHSAREQFPLQRLIHKVLLKLDPVQLAELPINEKSELSDAPNRYQRRLPINATGLYSEFFKDHQLFFQATGQKVVESDPNRLPMNSFGNVVYREPPVRLMLNIDRSDVSYMQISLRLLGKDGSIDYANASILPTSQPVDKLKRESALILDCVSEKARKFLSEWMRISRNNERVFKEPESEIKAMYLDPIQNEPLALTTGAMVLAVAHERKENLVAVLPDDISFTVNQVYGIDRMKVVDIENAFRSTRSPLSIAYSADGIFVKPQYPSRAWESRIDRMSLKSLVQVMDNLSTNLDGKAKLALRLPNSYQFGLTRLARSFSANGSRSYFEMMYNRYHLRFYGLLTAAQKISLSNGGAVHMNSLNKGQLQEFINAALKEPSFWSSERPTRGAGSIGGFPEPSEMLSRSLSNESKFTMESEGSVFVMPIPYRQGSQQIWSSSDMAQYRARLQNPEKYGTESTYVTGYRLITSKNIVIRFALEPLTECQFKYLETEPDKSDKVLKESELPASFLEEVDQIYKSQYQGRSQDTSGSGTIKP